MSLNVYQRNGHANRTEYLRRMSGLFGLPMEQVQAAADLLGPEEDFDWLLSILEEAAEWLD